MVASFRVRLAVRVSPAAAGQLDRAADEILHEGWSAPLQRTVHCYKDFIDGDRTVIVYIPSEASTHGQVAESDVHHRVNRRSWGRVWNVDFTLVIVFDAELRLRFSRMRRKGKGERSKAKAELRIVHSEARGCGRMAQDRELVGSEY